MATINETLLQRFDAMCLRIKDNDPSLTSFCWRTIPKYDRRRGHDEPFYYPQLCDAVCIKLGQSLLGNTYLETLIFDFRRADLIALILYGDITQPGLAALARGFQNCRINSITIRNDRCQALQFLLPAIEQTSVVQRLNLENSDVDLLYLAGFLTKRETMVPCPTTILCFRDCIVWPRQSQEVGMVQSFRLLESCKAIHGFELINKTLSTAAIGTFVRSWRDDSQLKHLALNSASLVPTHVNMLMRAVANHSNFEYLDLSNNPSIGYLGLQCIGEGLGNVRLLGLNICNCLPHNPEPNLVVSALQALADGLSRNTTLQRLDWDQHELWPDGMRSILLCTARRPVLLNTKLTIHSLAELKAVGEAVRIAKLGELHCEVEIEREGADDDELCDAFCCLAQGLQNSHSLLSFGIVNSTFFYSFQAATPLMVAVNRHSTIQKFQFGGIRHDGLCMIGDHSATSSLTSLFLTTMDIVRPPSNNEVSVEILDHAFSILANGVKNNRSIQELSVHNEQMRVTNLNDLMEAVTDHPTMQKLAFPASITTSYDEIKIIAKQVTQHLRLKELCFNFEIKELAAGSKAANEARKAIVQAMKDNYYLQKLTIPHSLGVTKEKELYLGLNGCGRLQLMGGNNDCQGLSALSPTLFCQFLSNVSSKTSNIYYFLCEHPWFISSSSN